MSEHKPLSGSCSCGRNKYTVTIPPNATEVAQVLFDNGRAQRRSQAAPLSAWLRVPLSWYSSSTYAFFDDESHSTIRRTYTSPYEQNAKRCFCGYCGTPLFFWLEDEKTDDAAYISLTLGSLSGGDLRDLEELGFLPQEALDDAENDREKIRNAVPHAGSNVLNVEANEGLPWFDTLVKGSKLGNLKKDAGRRRSVNSKWTVEWEILEWTAEDDDAENATSGKRKYEEEVENPGSEMEH